MQGLNCGTLKLTALIQPSGILFSQTPRARGVNEPCLRQAVPDKVSLCSDLDHRSKAVTAAVVAAAAVPGPGADVSHSRSPLPASAWILEAPLH